MTNVLSPFRRKCIYRTKKAYIYKWRFLHSIIHTIYIIQLEKTFLIMNDIHRTKLSRPNPRTHPTNEKRNGKKKKQKREYRRKRLEDRFEIWRGRRETGRKISSFVGWGRKREWTRECREGDRRFLRNSHGKLTGGCVWALCALWGCLGVAARCLQKQRTAAVTRPATLRIRNTSPITNQIVCMPRIVDASESVKKCENQIIPPFSYAW